MYTKNVIGRGKHCMDAVDTREHNANYYSLKSKVNTQLTVRFDCNNNNYYQSR